MHSVKQRISHWLWLAAYELEEARSAHAFDRRYMRSAACCVGLYTLTLIRGVR